MTKHEPHPAAWRAEKDGEIRFIQPRAWFYAESGYRQQGWTVTPLYEPPPSLHAEVRISVRKPTWTKVADAMPKPGEVVLAFYRNALGKGRRVRAMYAAPKSLEAWEEDDWADYDEKEGKYWCPEGWYESNEHEETYWMIDEEVTHWMPLPEPPEPENEG